MAFVAYVPTRIGEDWWEDLPVPGAGDDAKAITYDHDTGAFVYNAFEASGAVATHVALADPHTQYELEANNGAAAILTKLLTVDGAGSGLDADLLDGNSSAAFLLATGATTGATSQAQTFTNAVGIGAAPTLAKLQIETPTASNIGMILKTTDNSITNNLTEWRNSAGTVLARVTSGGRALFRAQANYTTAAISFSNFPNDGIDSDGSNFLIFQGGLLSLVLTNSIKEFRVPSNYAFGFSDSAANLGATDTSISRKSAGIVSINTTTINNSLGKLVAASFGAGVAAPTALLDLAASNTALASLRMRDGVAPAAPQTGDMYQDGTHAYMYLAGAWKQLDN